MKKLLALVLALVMTLSLCITSNAAFDGEEYDYDEAVEVMTKLGVFEGDENGKFNGKDSLTRAQAAKLIAYLMLGNKVAAALEGSGKVFSDVPASHWACGYIEYLATEGVISGVGDGKFDPNGALTNGAFAKMLLVVLGCDQNADGLTGASWIVKTAKLANQSKIFKGVDNSINAVATREEAAQYCFNAITKGGMYTANAGTVTTVNDVTVKTGAKASDWNGANTWAKMYAAVNYEDLQQSGVSGDKKDDFGRPAHTWFYGKIKTVDNTIGTYVDEADYTLTVTKDYTDLKKAYVDLVDDDYATNIDSTTLSGKVCLNGAAWVNATDSVKSGDVIDFYTDGDGIVTGAYVTRYSIAKITKVDTTVTKAQKEDGVTCKLTINGNIYFDTEVAGFNADTYTKGTYVLYVDKGGEVIDSKVAEVVEGKVTSAKGSNVTVDGTSYKNVTGGAIALNGEGKFYLNAAGQIMLTDVESTSDNYAYIYRMEVKSTGTGDDGLALSATNAQVTAYVVLADGTKASYKVPYDYWTSSAPAGKTTNTYYFEDTNVSFVNDGKYVIAYSVNDDNELVYETAADTLTDLILGATISKTDATIGTFATTKTAMATSATQFVFAYEDSGKMKTSVSTGYKNVNVNSGVYAVVDDDNEALFVFVGAENGSISSDVQYAVLLDADYTQTKDGSKVYNTYAVAVDGEETTITLKNATLTSVDEGEAFAFYMDGDYAKQGGATVKVTEAVATASAGEYVVKAATEDYVVITTVGTGDNQYSLADADLFTINMDYKKDGVTLDTVSVSTGAEVEADDVVYFVLDGTDVEALFVVNEIK